MKIDKELIKVSERILGDLFDKIKGKLESGSRTIYINKWYLDLAIVAQVYDYQCLSLIQLKLKTKADIKFIEYKDMEWNDLPSNKTFKIKDKR